MTTPATAYTDRLWSQSDAFMRNFSFYSALTLVAISAALVGYFSVNLIWKEPLFKLLFVYQCLTILSSYMIVGIGLGLPLIIIAATLSWGQLILLMTGNINPHLGREGFVDVLKILFNRI